MLLHNIELLLIVQECHPTPQWQESKKENTKNLYSAHKIISWVKILVAAPGEKRESHSFPGTIQNNSMLSDNILTMTLHLDLSQVALEGLRPSVPPGMSSQMAKLVSICWNNDPAKRPRFDQILPILNKMAQWIEKQQFINGEILLAFCMYIKKI